MKNMNKNIEKYICIACKNKIDSSNYKKYPDSTMDSLVEFDELEVLSCDFCQFSFPTRRVSEDHLEYYYSSAYSGVAKKVGKNFNKFSNNKSWYNPRYLSQIQLLRKYYDINSDTKILEIGSGIGDLFRTLKYLGYETQNYTIEPGKDAHPSLKYLGVNIFDMGLNKKSISKTLSKDKYDIILMSHSLEHFNAEDIPYILKEIYGSLSQNGVFLCEVPNANLIKYPDANDLVNPHLAFFSIDSIRIFFEKTGFKIAFLSSCGENQLNKKPYSNSELSKLTKREYFNYKLSDDKKVKINIGYHKWLKNKNKHKRRKMILTNILSPITNLFGLSSLIEKFRSINIYSVLSDANFIYSNDREFIRVIAKKS
ncbi:MAG: hypothetical protein CMG57_09775 [Candidatus Marinimicrobia bacterium]|nr:hypothetical protein [Candidatus Neomarinimicrobiota bacterium]|tara:strand:+ start:19438 stop:20541 length:1104 start_codon:yes stop_codon:yes gene_type:complete